MDKKVMFAVAGSGKTTTIINSITRDKRFLIITYTNSNYDNLAEKIVSKYNGSWPENVTLMKFFQFLYRFCYRPFLADQYKARGIVFESNSNFYLSNNQKSYYLTSSGYFYSNRLSLFLERTGVIDNIRDRIKTYFDVFIIDEVQDIAGRDFTFLEHIMETNVDMLFVGDYFQHTYDTSRDGNANKNLFDNQIQYEERFLAKNVILDHKTLVNSWRCSRSVCDFISANLGITIHSNRSDDTSICFVDDEENREVILNDNRIIKLHYQNSSKFGVGHKNWGDTKGEDCYQDVCIMLNKTTMKKCKTGKLSELRPLTRNKLYVAITRAHGNVYFMEE